MRSLIETSLRRPVTVIMLTIALVYFGVMSYMNMGMQQIPDVDLPVVMVTTTYDGATAAVMDNDVADVLEEKINTINGIDSLSSMSYMGESVTVVEFIMGRDIDAAAADVRDKVNAASEDLPDEADEPIIAKYEIGDSPLVLYTVTGDATYGEKVYFVDKIAKVKFQSAEGVGEVTTPGMREREIRIWIDPVRLRSRGLLAQDIKEAIENKHVELPGGSINMDRYKIDLRIQGEYASVEDLKSLPITTRSGVIIRLGEVADVEDGFEEAENAAMFNGDETIMIGVMRQRGANEVAVCDAIVEKYESEIKGIVPNNMRMEAVYNKSEFIRRSMHGVGTDIIQAVVLCSLLMLFFLQTFRATFVVIISMPVCLIGSLVVLNGLGVTINNLSMMGMSLAVGMVVDATTVVLENIDIYLHKGYRPRDAALAGTTEVSFSILGGNLTTIGVFAPIAFMGGVIGQFFYAFGITIVVTIGLSLIIALTLTPFTCSRILSVKERGRVAQFCNNLLVALENGYRRVLNLAVHNKTITMAIAVSLFIFGLFLAGQVGSAFLTNDDQGIFIINCELPSGTEIEETTRVMGNIATIARQNPAVLRTMVDVGSGSGSEPNKGSIYVDLTAYGTRDSQFDVMDQVRASLGGFKDVIMDFTTFSGKDFEMVLNGSATTEELYNMAQKIIADMVATGNVKDVDTDIKLNKPQLNINMDRNMTDAMNVDVRSLSTEIQAYFSGLKAGVFKEGGYRYDIRLMARRAQRSSLDDIDLLSFLNSSGEIIQAPGLITVEEEIGPSSINRYARQRAVTISGNVGDDFSAGEAVTLMQEIGKKYIPEGQGIQLLPSGRTKTQFDSFERLLTAIVVAISLVYIIMACQFESFLHPLTVMFSLPLMTPGSFGLMYIMGCKLDTMAYMGIILLVGIVVNNGIILVDFINQNRANGMSKLEAVVDAGPRRLRAILITSLSTLIGAIPAALKLSEGSESRQPMSVAMFGGLFTSTLLTLLVVPVMYLVLDNLKENSGKLLRRLSTGAKLRKRNAKRAKSAAKGKTATQNA